MTSTNTSTTPTLSVGDRVSGGAPDTEDYDTGTVLRIDGDGVHVAWDTGTVVVHDADELSPAPRCPRCGGQHACGGRCATCGAEVAR